MLRSRMGSAFRVASLVSFALAGCTRADRADSGGECVSPGGAELRTSDIEALVDSVASSLPERPAMASARTTTAGRADQPASIEDLQSGLAVTVALQGALDGPSESRNGCTLFRDAMRVQAKSGAWVPVAVVQHADGHGLEDFLLFPEAPAWPGVRYRLEVNSLVAGLRLVANTLELVDVSGTPRLRVTPPYLVDARQERHSARLSVEGCRVDDNPAAPWGRPVTEPGATSCTLAVTWESTGMAHPVALDPAWSTTGTMISRRDGHTATALGTGKILVTGGRDTGALSSAELYDTSSKTWAATASMGSARSEHVAVQMSSGHVLVSGGRIAVPMASAETYDAVNGTWSAIADMNQPRSGHKAVRLVTAEVLVTGGESISGKLASTELYNPSTSSWQTVASMAQTRIGHTLTSLSGGLVLVTGGENSTTLAVAELYSRTNDQWSLTGAMTSARTQHSALVLNNNKVLVTGGKNGASLATAEVYDPGSGTFAPTQGMAASRSSHVSLLLANGMALVAGGYSGAPVGSSELYDPVAGSWIPAGNLLQARSGAIGLLLSTQAALVAGGRGASSALDTAELFTFQPDGAPCAQRGECQSGYCVDGVCCESACAMTCMACSALVKGQGNDGKCEVVKAGLDPDGDCDPVGNPPCQTAGTCNGNGGCSTIAGYQCAPTSCASALVQNNASVCNAASQCVLSGTTDCSPYQCKNGSCLFTCTTSDDCMPGSGCVSSQCLPPGANGTPCTGGADCGSGHCVDGVCCDTDCVGTCQACKATLKATGQDGTCGAAKYGIPCGATTCANAKVTGLVCNSTGQCLNQTVSCTPYVACADATACPTSCVQDTECVSTHFCGNGECKPLLLTGQPCTGGAQCKTGFCVDGVCCSTSCGAGATDDCHACSVTSGATNDGVCAILDGVACATGVCVTGICKAVPEAGPDAEDAAADAEQDAAQDAALDTAQDVVPDAVAEAAADSSTDGPAPETGPAPEASVDTGPDDASASSDTGSGPPAVTGAEGDSGGCSCGVAGGSRSGALAWLWLLAAIPAVRRIAVSRSGRRYTSPITVSSPTKT